MKFHEISFQLKFHTQCGPGYYLWAPGGSRGGSGGGSRGLGGGLRGGLRGGSRGAPGAPERLRGSACISSVSRRLRAASFPIGTGVPAYRRHYGYISHARVESPLMPFKIRNLQCESTRNAFGVSFGTRAKLQAQSPRGSSQKCLARLVSRVQRTLMRPTAPLLCCRKGEVFTR